MLIRRIVYWSLLLVLTVIWFGFVFSDGTAACQAAAPRPPLDEFAAQGISYFPPGYWCLYIRHNSVEPFDAAGWIDWSVSLGIVLLLIYGALSFVVRLALRVRERRRTRAEPLTVPSA